MNELQKRAEELKLNPKSDNEKEFGLGIWVFDTRLNRPVITGHSQTPVAEMVKLSAKNVDEAITECRGRGLYDGGWKDSNLDNDDDDVDDKNTELAALRQEATELGISNANRMKAETLKERIMEAKEKGDD